MREHAVITAIRLLGFHNFIDETIKLPNGGHLFLLGDNGCGKTTVLDAIHYVLTGGEVEFNAAARVGAKQQGDGRRAQGIILRVNTEARSEQSPDGALNPAGGITYAALELTDPTTHRQTVVGIGMRASSMNEDLTRWGFIKTGALDDLTLYDEGEDGRHLFDEHELKERFGNAFYRQMSKYRTQLARLFFSDEATYQDICDLLATGKAYKEIVASTRNYDERFRRLLRVPDRELFSKVVLKLKEIREAKVELDGLAETAALLKALVTGRAHLQALAEERLCATYAHCSRRRNHCEAALQTSYKATETLSQQRTQLLVQTDELDRRIQDVDETILQLKAQDPAGLENQLQHLKREKEREEKNRSRAERAYKEACNENNAKQKALEEKKAELLKLRQAVGRERNFSVDLRLALERNEPLSDILREESGRLASRLNDLHATLAKDTLHCDTLQHAFTEAEAALELARQRHLPPLPEYAAALEALEREMTGAQPLYERLEPNATLREKELARFEQVCSVAALSVFAVPPEGADKARAILFKSYPGLALTVLDPDAPHADVAPWFRNLFSPDCDPEAINALWLQVVSAQPPSTLKSALGDKGVSYRGVEAQATRLPPQWIGTRTRETAHARRIAEAETALKQCERDLKSAQDRLHEHRQMREALTSTSRQLADFESRHNKLLVAHDTAANAVATAEIRRAETHEQLLTAQDNYDDICFHVNSLSEKVKKEGLSGLHRRITEAEQRKREFQDLLKESLRKEGLLENQEKEEERKRERWLEEIRDLEAQCAALLPQLPDAADKVFESLSLEALAERIQVLSTQFAEAQGRLREKVTSGEAANYGLRLDGLELVDHRGQSIDDLFAERDHALKRQEKLLGEKNRELFQELLLNELVDAMRHQVLRLREMERQISRLLQETTFGQTSYDFVLNPLPEYKDVLTAILHPNDPNADTILRTFLERHRDAIQNTPMGEVPTVLDYRNWYRYELRIKTSDGAGVMVDRKLKSLGSGGEQAVPNYLLILAGAAFIYRSDNVKLAPLLFDEAFYGIDAGRRDSLMAFADKLGLQIFVASPDQDGVRQSIHASTTLLVVKDANFDVHISHFDWDVAPKQEDLLLL